MTKIKIKVLKVFDPKEVFETSPVKQSKPLPPCGIHSEGQEFLVKSDMKMPEGFCHWAWGPISQAVKVLMFGGNYPWQEEEGTTVICCNDGLRPVVYQVERI